MNQWMDNARQRVELVCLAMFVGTVLFSGCSHNRSAEGGFPFWTRVSRTTDITSAVHSSPLIASASASSLPHSAETKVSSASVPSAYPPLHFASETPAPPEPEAVSQPLAPPLEVAKIDPRPALQPAKRAVIHANEATFEQEVLQSQEPVLVDFYASWCGPCKRLSPTLDEVAVESPRARVVKVNIEESPELASRYGVRSLPSLIVFKDGKAVSRQNGVVSKDRLHSLLDL